MTAKVFVPLTDDMLDALDCADAPVPYPIGAIPFSAVVPGSAGDDVARQSRRSSSRSPGATPSSAALPALSSSTYLAGPVLR